MFDLATISDVEPRPRGGEAALRAGLRKRAAGAPTYSVPEAAALLSVSRSHLYQLIRVGAFPALRMGLGAGPGRYVVSARMLESVLEAVPPGWDLPRVLVPDPASADAGHGGEL